MNSYLGYLPLSFIEKFESNPRRFNHMKTANRVFNQIKDGLSETHANDFLEVLELAVKMHDIGYYHQDYNEVIDHSKYSEALVLEYGIGGSNTKLVADLVSWHGLHQSEALERAIYEREVESVKKYGKYLFMELLDLLMLCDLSAVGSKVGTVYERIDDLQIRIANNEVRTIKEVPRDKMIALYERVILKHELVITSEF